MRDAIKNKMEEFVMEELGTNRRLPMDIYSKLEEIGMEVVRGKLSAIGLTIGDDAALSILEENVDLDGLLNEIIDNINQYPYMIIETRTSKREDKEKSSKIITTCVDGDLEGEIEYNKKNFKFYEFFEVTWEIVKFNKESGEAE